MKTKTILILLAAVSLFACKEEEFYTYEQFRITNDTQHELAASFDGVEHIAQPSEEIVITIARRDYEYTRVQQEDFPNIVSRLSIFRNTDSGKVYLAKEEYENVFQWGLFSSYNNTSGEKYNEVGYAITITEDMFIP